jgi:hypothetical protein
VKITNQDLFFFAKKTKKVKKMALSRGFLKHKKTQKKHKKNKKIKNFVKK